MSRAWREVESRRVWVWVWVWVLVWLWAWAALSCQPWLTDSHTQAASRWKGMKAALVCFRCFEQAGRQGRDNWGSEQPTSIHKAIAPAESQGNSSKRHLHSTPLRQKEQRKAQLKRSAPQRNAAKDSGGGLAMAALSRSRTAHGSATWGPHLPRGQGIRCTKTAPNSRGNRHLFGASFRHLTNLASFCIRCILAAHAAHLRTNKCHRRHQRFGSTLMA